MQAKKGDVLKTKYWAGVVLDVYTSEEGQQVIKLLSTKNILKEQPYDLLDVTRFPTMEVGSLADLEADAKALLATATTRVEEMLRLVNQ